MSEVTCARCKGHVGFGVMSDRKTYHAVCLIQSHADTIDALRAQLVQARSDALEEAAKVVRQNGHPALAVEILCIKETTQEKK